MHSHHSSHHHGHDHHFHEQRTKNKKSLLAALIITLAIMVLEFIGGLATNSLALISDSGHMLSDAASLGLSLTALWFAAKPSSARKTFGFYRFEILAALFNGVTLILIAFFIVWEAVERLLSPEPVSSLIMILIAAIGLAANLVSAGVLLKQGDVKGNVNLRSAYLHILGDALGSVGAIVAGIIMYFFSWYIADPLISIVVSVLIIKSAWGIVTHTVHILMEGTPHDVDKKEVADVLREIKGVVNVHDLHIWTITSGLDSLSCHLLIEDDHDGQAVLQQAINIIESRFHIKHATIQVEKSQLQHSNPII
jgi:cobalt-zinc-cadmium efflux system protein